MSPNGPHNNNDNYTFPVQRVGVHKYGPHRNTQKTHKHCWHAQAGRATHSFVCNRWRAVYNEHRAAKDELQACIMRRRISFDVFKSQYWEAMEKGIQVKATTLEHPTQSMLQVDDSCINHQTGCACNLTFKRSVDMALGLRSLHICHHYLRGTYFLPLSVTNTPLNNSASSWESAFWNACIRCGWSLALKAEQP
jgi:hypothetical protein